MGWRKRKEQVERKSNSRQPRTEQESPTLYLHLTISITEMACIHSPLCPSCSITHHVQLKSKLLQTDPTIVTLPPTHSQATQIPHQGKHVCGLLYENTDRQLSTRGMLEIVLKCNVCRNRFEILCMQKLF